MAEKLSVRKTVLICVSQDAVVLFFGSIMFSLTVEKWNLHKRIALQILSRVKSQYSWLVKRFTIKFYYLRYGDWSTKDEQIKKENLHYLHT